MDRTADPQPAIRPGVHRLKVLETGAVTPMMRRVTVFAPTLTVLPLRPAQDVGLVFADPQGREIRRRYTITRVDAEAETFALDGVLHGDGPGAAWFATTTPGAEIDVVGPRGKIELLPDVAWQLFVGDEAGLPAFLELLAGLPTAARATAVIEVDSAAEEQPWTSAGDVEVRWVHRAGRPGGFPDLLTEALEGLEHPDGPAQAYVLGESRAVVALNPALAALGISRAQTFVKGYWNRPRGL
jgi:NADPH-dependent ferric siderophore reductase